MLRPYQIEDINSIVAAWDSGHDATLAVLPTGSGKTVIFLGALEKAEAKRSLVLAHTGELISQAIDRSASFFPALYPVARFQAGKIAGDPKARLVVGTVQTASSPGRLEELLRHGVFTHLVIDEAHHAVSATYRRVIERLKQANPGLKILGVTATPTRADNDGLIKVFKHVSVKRTIAWMIENKYLCGFDGVFEVWLNLDMGGVQTRNGDFVESQLAAAMEAGNVGQIALEGWLKHAAGRPTIAFVPSIAMAHAFAKQFSDAGVKAEAVSGNTPTEERKAILRRYDNGETTVLFNAQLLTEGYDSPHTSCILQLRPTKSQSLYIQMIGRGLRPHPGKTGLLVLDFVPGEERSIVQAGDILGRPRKEREAIARAKKSGVILGSWYFDSHGGGIDAQPDQILLRHLDLLRKSRYAWTSTEAGLCTCAVGTKLVVNNSGARRVVNVGIAVAATPAEGSARRAALLSRIEKGKAMQLDEAGQALLERLQAHLLGKAAVFIVDERKYPYPLSLHDNMHEAQLWAEDFMDKQGGGFLSQRRSKWRRENATDAQLRMLGMGADAQITKGEASQLITNQNLKRALEKK